MTTKLSPHHADVLWVVDDHGPVTASEVGSHLLMSDSAARSALRSLEAKKLVDTTYTNLRAGRRGRGYVTTALGQTVVAGMELDDE